MTIRGRILVAFLIMSVITAALGAYATMGVRNAGLLVDKTFDESLMSINYARAAATDFAAMRAAFARRWIATDFDTRAALDDEFDKLGTSLSEDLAIAAQRSQSVRATRAAESVRRAVDAWKGICERLLDGTKLDVNWATLDQYTVKVDDQIDLLVNYTAGDGFLYRQSARAAVAHDIQLNIAGIALALLLSALVAWALARRIVGPVAVASNVAARIAAGKLDVAIPKGNGDELGALLTAMGVMRDNIKAMMDREVAQRRSAQARLADALENSQEGVVVVDANRRHRARQRPGRGFPRRTAEPAQARHAAGAPATGLAGDRGRRPRLDGAPRQSQRHHRSLDAGRTLAAHQPQPDPRPGLHRAVQRHQPPQDEELSLRETNLLLDAALENMTQGLCLYDAQNRLEVFNRRYLEIFGLPPDRIKPGITFREVLEIAVACNNHPNKTVDQLMVERAPLFSEISVGPHMVEFGDGRVVSCLSSPTSDGRLVVTYEDVTERRQAEAKIMHMARHDALTDLPNRVLFRDKMEQALDRGEKLAVMFLDLDRFKGVNNSPAIRSAMRCSAR